jgi:hypothetical protein
MTGAATVVLIAGILVLLGVLGLLFALRLLRREVKTLSRIAAQLDAQSMGLLADAHRVVDQAALEMERVGAVLESTDSVHATVDQASRLAYRAFANPVVKVLAVRAGAGAGLRRLTSPRESDSTEDRRR